MTGAEVASVVADLHREDGAIISITGDVRREDGTHLARAAGVHRASTLVRMGRQVAEARWYETALEWHARVAG